MAPPKKSVDPKASPEPAAPDRVMQVVQATCQVIAREGLDGATMRTIARELGVTTGVLTHYFKDKDDLLGFVLTSIFEALAQRTTPLAEHAPDLDRTIDALMELLPTDSEQMDWWKVWLAFTVAAQSRPERAAAHSAKYDEQRDFWVRTLRRLKAAGLLGEIDVAIEAETLMAIVDGLGVQAIISPERLTARRQRTLIRAYFAKISA